MSIITTDEVRRIARLAQIALTNQEALRFTKEFDSIVKYFRQIDTVDTSGLEPTYQVTGLLNVTRKDELADYGVNTQSLLKNAAKTKDDFIRVPKVL